MINKYTCIPRYNGYVINKYTCPPRYNGEPARAIQKQTAESSSRWA